MPNSVVEGYYGEEAEKVLGPVRHFGKHNGLRIATEHGLGPAGEAIAAFAERHSIDLIVMGSHGHSALVNVVLGSVATSVLAMSRIPVLIVR